jgi:hypothetical protein
MALTRRRLLTSIASAVAGGNGVGQGAQTPTVADTIKPPRNQQISHTPQHMNRNAFVTLPGISLTTTYMHLPAIMKNRPQPIIFMDVYDFERIWGQIVMQRGNRKIQMLGMITDSLYQKGFLQTIDYGAFYSAEKQDQHINNYWHAVECLPAATQQRAAEQLADGFLHHAIGEYQKPFRSALCNWDGMVDRRAQIEAHQQKIHRGGGNPLLWNERVAAEYIAALEVRAAVEARSDFDAVAVLGQGETQGISTVLRESDLEFDNEVISLTPSEQSIKQIWRPDPERTAYERSILDSVTQVAQETTNTQHNDWYLLGERLAVPHFPKLFVESWSQPNLHQETTELAAESREVLSLLEQRAADDHPSHLPADAVAIAEQHGDTSPETVQKITTELDRAVDLANYTPLLRELSETDRFSPGSIMVAGAILMDPNARLDEDETYRQAWAMKRRNRAVDVPQSIIERFSNRGGIRRGENKHVTDWYHSAKRTRQGVSS